jgi:rhamnosyltransferase subunit B
MARIVINSWGSYGDVNPYLALALALAERGHEPVMALPEHFRDDVERVGLTLAPVGRILAEDAPETPEIVERIMDPRRGGEFIYRHLMMPTIRETYAELTAAARGADLLISQPLGIAAPLVAEVTGIPWASTVLAPLSFASAHEMVVPPPLPVLKRLEVLGPGVPRFFAWFMRRVSRGWAAPVDALRGELGLPRGRHPIFEGQYGAPLVLAMFSRVLAAPQPDWPPNSHVTGQLVNDSAQGLELSAELEAFLQAGEPPVVFTLGSAAVRRPGTFFDESIRAIARLKQRAVFLAGEETTARLAASLPETMFMTDAAPHSLLFPRAALIVHQAGVGTLGTALRAGKPTIAVPFANDQPDNAWRIAQLGISRTIYPGDYRASNLIDVIDATRRDEARQRRAAEIGAAVRAERGPQAACDLIEQYLSAPSIRPPILPRA